MVEAERFFILICGRFPAAEKKEGESHIEAVIREVGEEYNLIVTADSCEHVLSYDHDNNLGDQIFVCRVSRDTNPELHEGAAMKWMTFEEIKTLPLAWQQNEALLQLEEKLKGFVLDSR